MRSAPESTRFINARPDKKWRLGRKHLVGYVGVMGLQDGLDYLIDAARLIISEWRREDIQFVLVGSGPEYPRLRQRVQELGLSDQVLLTGRLSDDDLGAVLASAECVNPDEANQMNDISTMNKVMEYMAFAKPMVQFDLHEGRFSAGDSSLYATRNDAASLARCITRLVDDQVACERMGLLGRERLITTLSWEAQIPELLAAYQRASGKRGGWLSAAEARRLPAADGGFCSRRASFGHVERRRGTAFSAAPVARVA